MAIETELFVADAYGAYADIAAASSRFSQDDVRLGFDTNEYHPNCQWDSMIGIWMTR